MDKVTETPILTALNWLSVEKENNDRINRAKNNYR